MNSSIPDIAAAIRTRESLQNRLRHKDEHNAVTLGSTSYFPVTLNTAPDAVAGGNLRDMGWLVHELTHQWQYQRMGLRYLTAALGVQIRLGRRAYEMGGGHPVSAEIWQKLQAYVEQAKNRSERERQTPRDDVGHGDLPCARRVPPHRHQ